MTLVVPQLLLQSTRIKIERENERKQRQSEHAARVAEIQRRKAERNAIRVDLYSLFTSADPHARGKELESVLNRLFASFGILIREAFTRRGTQGEGVIEEVDGVIELDAKLFLVEMKWWQKPIGRALVSPHLVRVFQRPDVGGICISATPFTSGAVATCRESLGQKTCCLCDLQEIFAVLESEKDLRDLLRKKIQASIVDKDPYAKPTLDD